jgi:hypothetical protein
MFRPTSSYPPTAIISISIVFSCVLLSLCEFFPEKSRFSDGYESSHDPAVHQYRPPARNGKPFWWQLHQLIRSWGKILFFAMHGIIPGCMKYGFARTLSCPESAGRYRCLSLRYTGMPFFWFIHQ